MIDFNQQHIDNSGEKTTHIWGQEIINITTSPQRINK